MFDFISFFFFTKNDFQRQGPCSDPPVIIDRITPIHMISNLLISWKTSNSVMLKWEYNGPQRIGFYVNQTGRKDYLDQHLQLKGMISPGFRQELDGNQREHLLFLFFFAAIFTIVLFFRA